MNCKFNENVLESWIDEEISLSNACADLAAARIHRQMAGLYAARLSELREPTPIVAVTA